MSKFYAILVLFFFTIGLNLLSALTVNAAGNARTITGQARVYTSGDNMRFALVDKQDNILIQPADMDKVKDENFSDCMSNATFEKDDTVRITGIFRGNSDGTLTVIDFNSLRCEPGAN